MPIKILRSIRNSWIAFRGGVKTASTRSNAAGASSRHVVENHVDINSDTDRIASLNHGGKFTFVSRSRRKLIRDWSVAFGPWAKRGQLKNILSYR